MELVWYLFILHTTFVGHLPAILPIEIRELQDLMEHLKGMARSMWKVKKAIGRIIFLNGKKTYAI